VTDPIHIPSVLEGVADPQTGGTVFFLGTVRDHHQGKIVTSLSYEAYIPMAEAQLETLVKDVVTRFHPNHVGVVHRIGPIPLGEAAVAIAVSSAHREAAFDACRALIEGIKARIPIWKHETYADGTSVWVNPTSPLPDGKT